MSNTVSPRSANDPLHPVEVAMHSLIAITDELKFMVRNCLLRIMCIRTQCDHIFSSLFNSLYFFYYIISYRRRRMGRGTLYRLVFPSCSFVLLVAALTPLYHVISMKRRAFSNMDHVRQCIKKALPDSLNPFILGMDF